MKLAERTFRKTCGKGADQYYITSPFGWRKDPISGEYKGHNGCDYGTHGNKWAQYALEDGTVESVYKDYYGALCVRVAYPRLGIRLTHAHLDCIKVSKGQSVNKDTVIGNTGTTGYSTGVHLHLGVQKIGDSMWIDPESIDYEEEKPVPTPEPTPCDKFNIGDKVVISGSLYVSANASKATGSVKDKVTNITRKVPGTAHPYNTTGDLGWMNESDITSYVEPPKPEPTPAPIELKFNVGDKVYIEGPLYISSDAEKPNGSLSKKATVITRVALGAKHPYNTTGDLGWMDESSITERSDEPTPVSLKVGDTVEIVGTGNGSSYGDKNTAYGIGWTKKIIRIYEGRPFPYQVGDSKSTVGFYKADALKKK